MFNHLLSFIHSFTYSILTIYVHNVHRKLNGYQYPHDVAIDCYYMENLHSVKLKLGC
jgi:hypothetical protein